MTNITRSWGKSYLNFNMVYMEQLANKKNYNLYKALITKVDSKTKVLEKITAMNTILVELTN